MSSGIQFDDAWSQRLLAIYKTPDVVAQRQAALASLLPQAGEKILDIGSGPGLMARELAQLVGAKGFIKGIDVSEEMNALARQVCADISQVDFEQVSATALPFSDATFDAAISMQTYEYVDDVTTALAELYRVLKPGGRALIVDTDWDTLVWHTNDRERMRRVLTAFEPHCSHPRLPRTLTAQLADTGFVVDDHRVFVVLNPHYDENTYTYGLVDFIASYVKNAGSLAAAEVEAWANELRLLGRQGNYFASTNRYLFMALKPQTITEQ